MNHDSIKNALDEQYDAVEAYCNSQIALYNVIHSKQGGGNISMRLVLRSYSNALSAVRTNLRRLNKLTATLPRNEQKLLRDHLARMGHVLAVIGGQPLVLPNGVPTTRSINADTFTLALSATRASIRLVKDAMG
jgi:hypothetical protein